MRITLKSIMVLVIAATVAAAQAGDERNAATWYQRAFAAKEQLTVEDWQHLFPVLEDPTAPVTPEVRDVLAKARPALEYAAQATQRGYADYGLNFADGFEMLLPHLSQMRGIARLMSVEAHVRLTDGDAAGAVERFGQMYRLAGHTADDRVLISSLVGMAAFRLGDKAVQSALDHGAIDATHSARLLEYVRTLHPTDPFRIVDALVGEQMLAVQSIERMIEQIDRNDPDGDAMWEMIGGEDLAPMARGMSIDGLRADLDQYHDFIGRCVEVFAMRDRDAARAELTRLAAQVEAGRHGVFAALLSPALERVFDNAETARTELQERIKVLTDIAEGHVDPQTLLNAAVFYRRGIERMQGLDAAWLEAMERLATDGPHAVSLDRLDDGVRSARAAIAEFMEGSHLRRCDFAPGRMLWESLVPRYAPGMRDAFRLLAVEALRQAQFAPGSPGEDARQPEHAPRGDGLPRQAGDHVQAVEHLAAAVRMAKHLGEDGLLVSSLISHDGFLLTVRTVGSVVEVTWHGDHPPAEPGANGAPDMQVLVAALRQVSPADPFGYSTATVRTREHLAQVLNHPAFDPRPPDFTDRLKVWLAEADADELFYLHAMRNQAGEERSPRQDETVALAQRLAEHLLPEVLELAVIDVAGFLKRGREGPWEFDLTTIPRLTDITARTAAARRDLSAAMRLVSPPDR